MNNNIEIHASPSSTVDLLFYGKDFTFYISDAFMCPAISPFFITPYIFFLLYLSFVSMVAVFSLVNGDAKAFCKRPSASGDLAPTSVKFSKLSRHAWKRPFKYP